MPEMTSRLSKGQTIAVLAWLPVHILLLPILASLLYLRGLLDEAEATFLVYAVGAVYMLLVLLRFFRRDFDMLWEHPLFLLVSVAGGYFICRFGSSLVALLFLALDVGGSNTNNEAIAAINRVNFGPAAATSVILAPIVEESIFRAGIFGPLRRKSRLSAYLVSILLFGLYHVWDFALDDPLQLLFVLEYVPAGFALAYIYERTDSIWGSVLLHGLINGLALAAQMSS